VKKTFTPLLFVLLAFRVSSTSAQENTGHSNSISITGYVDAYAAYYTDSVGIGNYQQFPSVSPRSNQFGLNVAMITAKYNADRLRATVALQYGDIPRSAWSGTFNPILEANAGIRICKELWLDAGFFRTHFGTEGLFPKENICNSVSLNTFYEPYFESGVKLNYNPTEKIALNIFLLNGYNMFEDNNEKKSFGLLATYTLGNAGNIGYSNYIGDDSPQGDSVSHLRFHNNLFFNYAVIGWKFQIGGDYCIQENSDIDQPESSASMFSGVVTAKYTIAKKLSAYARYEFFNDPNGSMSPRMTDVQGNLTGFIAWGITGGAEFRPTDNSYIRFEARTLQFDIYQQIFYWNGEQTNKRMEAMLNLGVWFE